MWCEMLLQMSAIAAPSLEPSPPLFVCLVPPICDVRGSFHPRDLERPLCLKRTELQREKYPHVSEASLSNLCALDQEIDSCFFPVEYLVIPSSDIFHTKNPSSGRAQQEWGLKPSSSHYGSYQLLGCHLQS
jgi:hypothetical protein